MWTITGSNTNGMDLQPIGELLARGEIDPPVIDGHKVLAIIPIEHLAMYTDHKRIGVILQLGNSCACCHKTGVHFVLLKRRDNHNSFTLYTEDWIELTIDHIKAKSQGGSNHFKNFQILCETCNKVKGDKLLTVEQLRALISNMFADIIAPRGILALA